MTTKELLEQNFEELKKWDWTTDNSNYSKHIRKVMKELS